MLYKFRAHVLHHPLQLATGAAVLVALVAVLVMTASLPTTEAAGTSPAFNGTISSVTAISGATSCTIRVNFTAVDAWNGTNCNGGAGPTGGRIAVSGIPAGGSLTPSANRTFNCTEFPQLCPPAGGVCGVASNATADMFVYTGPAATLTFTFYNDAGFFPGASCSGPGGSCAQRTVAVPDCSGGGGPVIPGGGTTGTSATVAQVPFIDPGVASERAQGIERVYFNAASRLIVYNQPYGYQFYTWTGEVVGLVDVRAATIPGPGGLIASISNGQWRVDFYYMGGDNVQGNLYQNGALLEEARFNISGLAARSTGGPGQAVPSFGGAQVVQGQPGGGSGGASVASPAALAEVVCRQNLRQNASTDTPVMDVLSPGAALTIVGRSNDNSWLNVTTGNGLTGWIFNGQCVNTGNVPVFQAPVEVVFENQATVDGQGVVVAQPSVAAAPAGSPVVTVVCRQNLRLGPGTDYATNRVLEVGAALSVVGRSADGTWLQVSGGDAAGWVYFGQCVLPQAGDVTSAPVTAAIGG